MLHSLLQQLETRILSPSLFATVGDTILYLLIFAKVVCRREKVQLLNSEATISKVAVV